jgi:LysM repeat protein
MRRVTILQILALILLLAASLLLPAPAQAQAGTPAELINGVNALRQSQGLSPYTVDSFLMQFAQSHSDYMASLGYWTHTRADGTTAFDQGIKENVAMGLNMSVTYCIYTVWADWVHWETMVGFPEGQVGAGVTMNGDTVYYTLNVRPAAAEVVEENPETGQEEGSAAGGVPKAAQDTPVPISPVTTSTPNEDGIIVHIVQYGETLWSISQAYGVPIDQILRNSGLSPATEEVFEGQRLLIQTATEPSPTPSPSATPDPGTPTPTQPRPTFTPFPTRTPAPTGTPTAPLPAVYRVLGNGKNVGIGLILVSGLGLILVVYLGFLKKPE